MRSFYLSLEIAFASFTFLLISPTLHAQTDSNSHEKINCALVQRLFWEGYNQRNLNMLNEVVAVDYVELLNGIESKGLISIIKSIKWLEEIAPDFKLSMEDIICKEDKVVVRWKYEGTNMKYNKPITLDGIYIALIKDMKITQGWQVFDNYQRFSQLGYLIEAPADSTSAEY